MDTLPERTTHRVNAAALGAVALLLLAVHFAVGNGYGFHRDELQLLDDARHLHWGFVAYPPLTALLGRISIALFGISPQVFRLPSAAVNAGSLVLAGLMARELGANRMAQLITALAVFPVAMAFSSVLQYNSTDLLAWSLLVFFTARVLRTRDPRNWIGAGVGVGIGVLSKYAIAFPVLSLFAALLAMPSQRHQLRSRWFWGGATVAAAIAAPNLIWLLRQHFITLQMERHIHLRDIRLGRASTYFPDQIRFTMLAFPLAVAGLVSLVRSARFRLLSAFWIGPFLLIALARGRGYYLLPAYPILYAAGATALECFLAQRSRGLRAAAMCVVALAVLVNSAAIVWAVLPVWKPGSSGWNWQMKNNADMGDEIGWPELAAQVAAVRDRLPAADRASPAVLANNYGEAGALALYGPGHGLPTPISSVNSFYERGYGPFEPETVIVLGGKLEDQLRNFERCTIAAQVAIPYGVRNEEAVDHPDILVCHHLRLPWPEAWKRARSFG